MIVNFFDKDFNPLTDNSSLNVESFELVRMAVDIDTFTCTCQSHSIKINPFFITLEDNHGRYVYGALAGLPANIKRSNKTDIIAADLKTLFKGDVVADFTTSTFTNLKGYIQKLFSIFSAQLVQETFPFDYDLTDIETLPIDMLVIKTDKAFKTDLWALISEVLLYNDCYIESRIQLYETEERNRNGQLITIPKGIHFRIARNDIFPKSIILTDYNVEDFAKRVSPTNEFVAYDKDLIEIQAVYYLKENNKFTTNKNERDLFPVKRKIFASENSKGEALLALFENRYQENISINLNRRFEEMEVSGILREIENKEYYFDTLLTIYPKAEYDEGGNRTNEYKSLPIGAIGIRESKNESIYWIEAGYRPSRTELLLKKLIEGANK